MAWFDTVFEEKYDRFTFPVFSAEKNEDEVGFLESALRLTYQDQILDCACGHGRHANILAAEGFSVTGCDASQRYLAMAAENAPDPGPKYELKDLRTLDYSEEFSAAYCFFSSFGYYDDQTNFEVLRNLLNALKEGGRLLIDVQNRELYTSSGPYYQEHFEFERDGQQSVLLMNSSFDLITSRVSVQQKLHVAGQVESMRFDVRLYTFAELAEMLRRLNATVVRSYGDTDGSEYGLESERMILVARKLKSSR